MERTEVAAERSAGEITSLLVQSGAREIATKYAHGGRPTGLRFVIEAQGLPLQFELPVRVDAVHELLKQRRGNSSREAAERIAWRQLFRWVQAQFAMIETGMVQSHEVFFPYMLHPGRDQTMFEYFVDTGLKQITAGGGR